MHWRTYLERALYGDIFHCTIQTLPLQLYYRFFHQYRLVLIIPYFQVMKSRPVDTSIDLMVGSAIGKEPYVYGPALEERTENSDSGR